MPRSTSESFRDNEYACATFATPFGIPFFGWSGAGYQKLSMDELRPQYEAWERHQAALRAQALAVEAEEERKEEECIEEVLFEVVEDDQVQNPNYLTVEDYVPEITYDTKPLTIREVDTSSLSWKGPSKFIVIVQDVEADSAYIQDKLDIGEAFVTVEVVSEDCVLEVNDAANMRPQKPSTWFTGADLLERIFGTRNTSGHTNDIIAAEELAEEREVEAWLFVGVHDDESDDEDVACVQEQKQRRPHIDRRVKRTRRSLAPIGNKMR